MQPSHSLRSLDVVVVCRLFSLGKREWTYATLAADLDVAASTAHESVDRCRKTLLYPPSREVAADKLRDLLLFTVPLVYPPSLVGVGSGTPTASAAPYSTTVAFAPRTELPYVWPGAGKTRGLLLCPVHPAAVRASLVDPLVYDLLALADVRRVGSVPDKDLAGKKIEELLRRR
jgi:hypothetical protein